MFQARLEKTGWEYATLMSVETACMWTWLMTDFLYEKDKERHPCDMTEWQQGLGFLPRVCHRWSDSPPAQAKDLKLQR